MLSGHGFLDLYAGSGAVALEAASRGAAPVVAVESDRRAAEVIRRNAAETKLGVRVVPVTVEKYLGGEPQQFELCWLDPPYAVPGQTVSSVVDRLAQGWLAPGGIVVSCTRARFCRRSLSRRPIAVRASSRRASSTPSPPRSTS